MKHVIYTLHRLCQDLKVGDANLVKFNAVERMGEILMLACGKVVNHTHGVPVSQERIDKMGANKPRATGYQRDGHKR